MKPILFLVGAASNYHLLRFVALHLVREGRPVAYLYERGADDTFARICRDAEAHGGQAFAFEVRVDEKKTAGGLWREHPRAGIARRLALVARIIQAPRLENVLSLVVPAALGRRLATSLEYRLWGKDLVALRDYRRALGARLAAAVALIRQIDPSAIVASEDGIAAALPIHAAAREAGVPVLEVPYGYGVRRDLEISLENKAARGELERVSGICGRLVARFTPQWIKQGNLAGALMFAPPYIVAAESLGITVRDAWIIHGGYAQRLCAESEQMLDVYRSEGIPDSKLRLTGTPYCDAMVAAIENIPAAKAALRQPRRLNSPRTSILVSWPPNYHGERGSFNEFVTYREMSAAVLGWLDQLPGCDLTVSLHPATLVEDRVALASAGIRLTDAYVIDLIPQHDLFITYFSSTIRWAIAAGKPVVNYDAYGLGLDVFASAPGVATVKSVEALKLIVGQLVSSEEAFAAAARRQIAEAPRWGAIDGANTARIAEELDRLIA